MMILKKHLWISIQWLIALLLLGLAVDINSPFLLKVNPLVTATIILGSLPLMSIITKQLIKKKRLNECYS